MFMCEVRNVNNEVADNSIRLRILKGKLNQKSSQKRQSCRQFDPVADTESLAQRARACARGRVADNSIRLRILKVQPGLRENAAGPSCRQFDPVADTERCSCYICGQ